MKRELRKPISERELDRRFKAVKEAMERERLDWLIMQNNNQFLGGYILDTSQDYQLRMDIFPL